MRTPIIVICSIFLFSPSSIAQNTNTVTWSAIDMGFAVSTSSNNVVKSAVGQMFVDVAQQSNTHIQSGFLADTLMRGPVTSIDEKRELPLTFLVTQNYPNPFNSNTTIRYEIPYRSRVEIHIYNMIGQQIASLLNEVKEAGRYEITWDGINSEGQHVNSGVYFYRLRASDFVETKKLLLLK